MDLFEIYVVIISLVFSDMIVGLIAESLLIKEQKGTKFRWTLSPFKPYLTKNRAIAIAIVQSSITIIMTLFVATWIESILTVSGIIVLPFSIMVFAMVYVVGIRLQDLKMYKFTGKEIAIVLLLIIISIVWILIILGIITV